MILKNLKVLDIQRLGDTNEGTEASISNESLPFVFEILSTKFYSNPIGSIIREITSNCFDSHAEANIDEPIIIRKSYNEEEGYSIEFQDFGVGLSVERMYGVYMNYFSSTKRTTNDLIGGFGLGSKTPLSYAEYFYITTVFNGMEYQYLYHKGEKMPTLESLTGYDEVEEEYEVYKITDENGDEIELEEPLVKTRIKNVPIGIPTESRNGTIIKIVMEDSDIRKFEEELKLQLSYFDSVYFEGWRCSNVYDIYEGKYFKFRSDINQEGTNIHLCIGKVRYAIDFSQVTVNRDRMGTPIGVKFEIGELEITPNRESIRYDKASIELIKARIDLALEELVELYNAQNPEVETLEEYNNKINSDVSIVFDAAKNHAIKLWSYSGLSKNFKFKPIARLGLKKTPAQLFFNWKIYGELYSSETLVIRNYGYGLSNKNVISGKYIILDRDSRTSKYTDVNIYRKLGGVLVLRRDTLNMHIINTNLGINDSKRENGKAKMIYSYNKIIDGIVRDRSMGNYEDFRPTDEWIANYKKELKEESLAFKRRQSRTVFVREIGGYSGGKDMKIYELERRTGILVYGFKEDKDKLISIHNTVTSNVSTIRKVNYGKTNRAFMVLQISRAAEMSIIGGKKTIYWEDFIKTKFFANIYSAKWLRDRIGSTNVRSREDLKQALIPGYANDIAKFDELKGRYLYDSYTYFDTTLVGDTNIKINPEMVKMLEYLTNKYDNIKIPFQNTITNLPRDSEDCAEYISYLKSKKVRILNKFYLKDKRQLEYEEGIRLILNLINGKVKNQLLLTINQTENGNEDNN